MPMIAFLGRGWALLATAILLSACAASEPEAVRQPNRLLADEELVSLDTERGSAVRILITAPRGEPKGVVVHYPGGSARFVNPQGGLYGPFRRHFVERGYVVALVDIASDAPPELPHRRFQTFLRGPAVPVDGTRVFDFLARRYQPPFILMGHSNGTVSASSVAAHLKADRRVGALVLLGAQTPKGDAPGIVTLRLADIAAPVLIVGHRDDGCASESTLHYPRYFTASPRAQHVLVTGGAPQQPDVHPCQGNSHMFNGAQPMLAQLIIDWAGGKAAPETIAP